MPFLLAEARVPSRNWIPQESHTKREEMLKPGPAEEGFVSSFAVVATLQGGLELKTLMGDNGDRGHYDQDCLVMHTSRCLFKPKPHARTSKEDLESLDLLYVPNIVEESLPLRPQFSWLI